MKISIITVCFNSAATVERTLKSVAEQTYANLEHVIIDGASKDQTLELVRRYPQRLGAVVSESDKGIYDAMNKGVGQATGDYFLFLNSDDWLAGPTVIAEAVAKFDSSKRMQHGCLVYHHSNGGRTQMGGPVVKNDLRFELRNLHQPATFFHRDLFHDHGLFNIEYRISADYDLMRRILEKEPSHFLNMVVTNMSDAGASAKQISRGIDENIRIATGFGEAAFPTWLHGKWVAFWLGVRYNSPGVYRFAKSVKSKWM